MTLLVLSVDRDDDLGEKAGVEGPVVGREANLEAATSLALEDAEDSDANTLFAAVNLHDDMEEQGEDVEVVTLTGDADVGATSDRAVTNQLEEVLAEVPADRCMFVTDGAEDEHVLPLVTSRVPVESVHRVVVRQNADIEGTYYVIKRALEDEEMQRTFLIPAALGLLVYGIFAVSGAPEAGVGAISITLGTYFIVKILHLESSLRRVLEDTYEGLANGKVSLFTSLMAGIIMLGGAIKAADDVLAFGTATPLQYGLVVADTIVWWAVVAGLVAVAGRALDSYFQSGRAPWHYWMLPFSLVALGFIVDSSVQVVKRLVGPEVQLFTFDSIVGLILGFTVAFIGTATNTYVKETFGGERPGRDEESSGEETELLPRSRS
jgi:putative membrane protein